ncbi:hypothetical protein A2982_01975 [candidate division WWE3 bacterium RIFCSPLOWO2_01_FULL_39_13]|uniref:DUF5667 domain-containing protein n=1 Tax=candidate division WWE3 bacterium RIFCSPLOWO2_01_FULL_39_13 TaxID=1802624 RepID=A0A1F4V362_UNCKA|nr:MAG: hypothetical protein A2982_01975 [candidate division WWE3 bacterium RIFCSPLOWO2_01_FULL_39_13]
MPPAKSLFFVLLLSVIFTSHASAEVGNNLNSVLNRVAKEDKVQNREDGLLKNTSKDVEEKRFENVAVEKERIQNKAQETRIKLVQVHAERLRKRFTFYYERLQKLIDKLQNRITAMDEKGIDVSVAQAKLNEASALLESTKTEADQAVVLFKSIDTEDMKNTGDVGKQMVSTAEGIRENYVEVVKLLHEVVSLLKNAVKTTEE